MIKDIFQKTDSYKFFSYLTALLIIIGLEIVLTCLIPTWRTYFYNILQNKHQALFMTSLVYFAILMIGLGAVQGLKTWIGQLVSFEVRKAATKLLFKTWVKGERKASNYTQAMTEALRNSTELYLEIAVEILISASIVIALIVSNIHNLPILVASIVYTIAASALAALFNRPLVLSDRYTQEAEGRYREAISDIANGREDFTSKEKFAIVIKNYYTYIKTVMYFTLFSRIKSSVASIIPYLLLASPFFTGAISLGDFMAGVTTFELIVINSTILIVLYPKLTKARASYQLSKDFYEEIRSK